MYFRPDKPWPTINDSLFSADMWANMFVKADATEEDSRSDYACDLYNLAHFFWCAIHPLANRVQKLSDAQRLQVVAMVDRCEAAFLVRFPTIFPPPHVRHAFAALRSLFSTERPRRDDFARAAWMCNRLHNVYLEAQHFPAFGPRAVADSEPVTFGLGLSPENLFS